MRARRDRQRVEDWERVLARIQMFGFQVCDDGGGTVALKRDGRTSSIDLVTTIRISGDDPRDIWLLKRAIEDGSQWEVVETYFIRRVGDGAIMPVELRLGRYSDDARTPFLDHDGLDGDLQRTPLRNIDALLDALPVLAAPNSIGYHAARERIITTYERFRPRTWEEIGISDSALIAEFEVFYVTADDVAHARAGGMTETAAIIAAYGMPPLRWADDDQRSE